MLNNFLWNYFLIITSIIIIITITFIIIIIIYSTKYRVSDWSMMNA